MTPTWRLRFLMFVGALELINLLGPMVSDKISSDPALSAGFMALVGVVLSGKWPGSDEKDGEKE